MEKGFEFIIDQDFHLYMTDKGKALNSQEFAYQYSIEKTSGDVQVAKLDTGDRSVKLIVTKNLHGFYSISKYCVYSRTEFERGDIEYRKELIEEMCSILGKSSNKDYSYEHYQKIRLAFLYEFYFEIKGTGTPYNFKEIKSIKNISSLNEDTFFNSITINNEIDLFTIMYSLI